MMTEADFQAILQQYTQPTTVTIPSDTGADTKARLRAYIRDSILEYARLQTENTEEFKNWFFAGIQGIVTGGLHMKEYVAPDQRAYRAGDTAYWLPDYETPHHGPCPICIEYGSRYQFGGGNPKLLWDIMMSPAHIELHRNAKIKRPVCYCRIITSSEGGMNGWAKPSNSSTLDWGIAEDMIKRLLFAITKLWSLKNLDTAYKTTAMHYKQLRAMRNLRKSLKDAPLIGV